MILFGFWLSHVLPERFEISGIGWMPPWRRITVYSMGSKSHTAAGKAGPYLEMASCFPQIRPESEVGLRMILYRPIGVKELDLIVRSGYRKFPPRLPEQPIFYPVLNFAYAEQIARDWNAKSGNYAGFVTRSEIEDVYVSRFETHTVGQRGLHEELWVPAEELDEFNAHIIGKIAIEAAYYGEGFRGEVDSETNLPVDMNKWIVGD